MLFNTFANTERKQQSFPGSNVFYSELLFVQNVGWNLQWSCTNILKIPKKFIGDYDVRVIWHLELEFKNNS